MGYYTQHTLEYKVLLGSAKLPSCEHTKPGEAKFCPECGKPIKEINILERIDEYLAANEEMQYSLVDGVESKWYEHRADMQDISKVFPGVLFILNGVGEESGDIWREYHLDGKYQCVKADITYQEFDQTKLD